jgi:predicted metal-dependent hydrolase
MSKLLQLAFDFLHPPEPMPAEPIAPAITPKITPQAQPELRYEILHSPRRRTLGLEIHRDLRIVIRAPLACPEELITRYLARNRRWINRQLAHFKTLPPPRAARRYVDGEPHLYLGQEYRLTLKPDARSRIVVEDDALVVYGIGATSPTATQSALTRWYSARAQVEFHRVLAACHAHPRFATYPLPALKIRTMRTRWGTMCTQRGMTLNSVLIQAPRECIEYVVFHELCHLSYRGHGQRFYKLLTAVLPNWEALKQQLEATITW